MENTEKDMRPRATVTIEPVQGLPRCNCGRPDHEHAALELFSAAPFAYLIAMVHEGDDRRPLLTISADSWAHQPHELQVCAAGLLDYLDRVGLLEPVLSAYLERRAVRDMERAQELMNAWNAAYDEGDGDEPARGGPVH